MLTKQERRALRELRRYVTLRRAALSIPSKLGEMGGSEDGSMPTVFELYRLRARAINDGASDEPRYDRPLAEPDAGMTNRMFADASDLFTNDVAEALRIYTESWVLPIIDALLDDTGTNGGRSWDARETLAAMDR